MNEINTVHSFVYILLGLSATALVVSLIFMTRALIRYYKLKQTKLDREMERATIVDENKNKTIEYSNSILDLVQMIVSRIAVLKFRTFQDTHDIQKVTKAVIVPLIQEIADTANKSLNRENFSLNDTFFTEEFYEKYIVETTIILVKEMLAKVVDDFDDLDI